MSEMHTGSRGMAGSGGSSPGLSFDRAEFDQAPAFVCVHCGRPPGESYYLLSGKEPRLFCPACAEGFRAYAARGFSPLIFLQAALCGLAAAVAAAVLWFAVSYFTGLVLGIVAIVVGVMVGLAVRKGSRGRGGWPYQALAILLTYMAVVAGFMPDFVAGLKEVIEQQEAASHAGSPENADSSSADSGLGDESEIEPLFDEAELEGVVGGGLEDEESVSLVEVLFALGVLYAYFLKAFLPGIIQSGDIMMMVIVGIALYEAWKLNKRIPLSTLLSGPFRSDVAPAAAEGTRAP